MKNLLLLLCVIALFTSCSSDDSPKSHRLDPNATILLNPDRLAFHTAHFTMNAASDTDDRPEGEPGYYSTTVPGDQLSPLEIVKQAGGLFFIPPDDKGGNYTFSPGERDFDTPCLKMFGDVIINQDGELVYAFIDAKDVVVTRVHNFLKQDEYSDTIAYVPNSVLLAAAPKIKAAYNEGDYAKVYSLFHEAYTFRPITGKKWEALKAKGEE